MTARKAPPLRTGRRSRLVDVTLAAVATGMRLRRGFERPSRPRIGLPAASERARPSIHQHGSRSSEPAGTERREERIESHSSANGQDRSNQPNVGGARADRPWSSGQALESLSRRECGERWHNRFSGGCGATSAQYWRVTRITEPAFFAISSRTATRRSRAKHLHGDGLLGTPGVVTLGQHHSHLHPSVPAGFSRAPAAKARSSRHSGVAA
jgi:hypothetical protein